MYKIGQSFLTLSDVAYVLAQTERNKVCLICLRTGNRWRDPVRVSNSVSITAEEFAEIAGSGDFYLSAHYLCFGRPLGYVTDYELNSLANGTS